MEPAPEIVLVVAHAMPLPGTGLIALRGAPGRTRVEPGDLVCVATATGNVSIAVHGVQPPGTEAAISVRWDGVWQPIVGASVIRLAPGEVPSTTRGPLVAMSADDPSVAVAHRASRRSSIESALGARFLASEGPPTVVTSPRGPFVVDRYATASEPRLALAVTNGLSDRPLPGRADEPEPRRVELMAIAPGMGPRIVHALSLLACSAQESSPRHPLGDWDRLVFGAPIWGDVAGGILRPLTTLETSVGPVLLYDVLPILTPELASFRGDESAHDRWVERRGEVGDYADLHDRWMRVFEG